MKTAETSRLSDSMTPHEVEASQGLRRLREAAETAAILSERIEDSGAYPFAGTETALLLREASETLEHAYRSGLRDDVAVLEHTYAEWVDQLIAVTKTDKTYKDVAADEELVCELDYWQQRELIGRNEPFQCYKISEHLSGMKEYPNKGKDLPRMRHVLSLKEHIHDADRDRGFWKIEDRPKILAAEETARKPQTAKLPS